MPFDVPSFLGPFSVDEHGRLAPRDPNALPAFLFRWRGRVIRARMRGAEPELGRLQLRSVLGRVPSSAGIITPQPARAASPCCTGCRANCRPAGGSVCCRITVSASSQIRKPSG